MALKVIGAGLGRTGTFTLKTALEMLGLGPCHHMVEVFGNAARQVPLWNRAADGEPVDWDEVFAGYNAAVDWPGCHFYAELAAHYPDAKVILSKRDPERWYESMSETILKSMRQMGLMDGPAPKDHPMYFGGVIIPEKTFGFDYGKANVIAAFERHVAAVRATIALERLLEFEASQGWEPLCAFLGVPVPDGSFPHTNSREEFWQHVDKAKEVTGI